MKKKLQMVAVLLSTIFLFFSLGQVVQADEMVFSWEAKLPENQRDKTKTYYDLQVEPGQVQDLELELKNTSDEPITVNVETNTAVTNDNGVIDYGIAKPKIDATMKSPFSEIAEVEPEVTLQPKETKVVTIKVNIPSEPFEGIILGGIRLSQKDEESNEKEKAGVQIKNKFAVVIGVRITENDNPVEADMKLLGVKPGQNNYRNVILANLQNPTPRIINDITVTADVYAAGNTDKPVYHSKQENLQMAPNSNFNYGITMNNKSFKAGKYLLKMVTAADGKEWKFEKEFEIKPDEAKKFNDEAVELAEEPTDYTLYIIIAIVVVVLLIIAIIVWVIHSKRKAAELAKSRKKAKRKKNGSKSPRNKK